MSDWRSVKNPRFRDGMRNWGVTRRTNDNREATLSAVRAAHSWQMLVISFRIKISCKRWELNGTRKWGMVGARRGKEQVNSRWKRPLQDEYANDCTSRVTPVSIMKDYLTVRAQMFKIQLRRKELNFGTPMTTFLHCWDQTRIIQIHNSSLSQNWANNLKLYRFLRFLNE